jgi:dCMP deaminase
MSRNHTFNEDSSTAICRQCGIQRDAKIDDPRKDVCRPIWHETWINIAKTIAERSYDVNMKVGAIIVSDDNTRVLSVGYNGNFAGGPNNRESDEQGQSGFLHAELNCCLKCDYNFTKKKVMYVTHSPCKDCCKVIVNAGISSVIYENEYRDTSGLYILENSGISVHKYSDFIFT